MAGEVIPGETLHAIGGMGLEADDLMRFPAFWGARAEAQWWKRQQSIYQQLRHARPIAVEVASAEGGKRTVWVTPQQMSWSALLRAGLPFYLSGLILACLAVRIPFRDRNPANLITKVWCGMMGLYHMAATPIMVREIAFHPLIRLGLTHMAVVAISASILLILWAVVFPKKKRVLETRPWLIYLPYVYYGLSVMLYFGGVVGFGSAAVGLAVWPMVFIPAALHSCCTEEDVLHKQQLRLFMAIPVLLALFFVFYIVLSGGLWQKPLDYPFFAVLSIVFGFSLMLAVENQRIFLESLEKEQQDLHDRLQMVREMHDNFSNTVAGIIRWTHQAEGLAATSSQIQHLVCRIRTTAQACWQEARNFIVAVDPDISIWSDVLKQCHQTARQILEPESIHLIFQASCDKEDEMVRSPVQYHLNGIIREALNNVIKHAGASRVTIESKVEAEMGVVSIEDNGRGFDPAALPSGTYGLSNMTQRAKKLGGHLSIQARDTGTRLRVEFRV
ncbi:MAG: ATP-binding protein [Kiritimatiellae bacterium]|nr:ATP-binding protein [Kiritimatiellia bacterium]MDD4341202.1 ATP-binding protein [Kiritimatiellia bacterium]